jgi:hypothetical protein
VRLPPNASEAGRLGLALDFTLATDVKQRGLHNTGLMTLMACHRTSGATPPDDLHADTPDLTATSAQRLNTV